MQTEMFTLEPRQLIDPKKSKKRYLWLFLGISAIIFLLIITIPKYDNTLTKENGGYEFTSASLMWDPYDNAFVKPRACLIDAEGNVLFKNETCLQPSAFRELPPMPDDFWATKSLFLTGILPDFCERLNESYWKQPEWLKNWEQSGLPHMVELKNGREADDFGYGSFPLEYSIRKKVKPGERVYTCNYFMTAYGIPTTQAFKIVPRYRSQAQLYDNTFLGGEKLPTEQQINVKDYFDIEVSPEELVLGHTYPYFKNNWIEKVSYLITVKPNTPPGRYILNFDVAPVASETYEQLIWQEKTKLYAVGYAGIGVSPDRAFLTVGIEVE